MDICISSRHSPSASDCMEGVSFFIRHWKPLSFGIGILYLFFLVLNCLSRFGHFSWAWKISYLAGTFFPVLFLPVLFSFLFLPIQKKQETYHPNRTAACCRLGYFFHFLFARIPLERSRCRPSQPYLHHGLMVFNMVLVGFILSAYRYDLVTAEPAECTSTVSL